jgi:formylglycine-generating enzyme required for sulfatase activity
MVSPVDGMVMVYVPEGTFLMGSTSADGDAHSNEFPQHEVYLDAFWIDRTEVTNAMYAAFLNARGNQLERGATWLDADDEDARIHKRGGVWEADAGYEDHPVIEVSWYGAQAYCEWAGRRLPTEAEWEKAARGTEGQLYPWGDEPPTCSLAQYVGCEGQTVPVGSKPDGESPYGAWDMAGNVWEWVADWYDADYYETLPAENPLGPGSGTYRGLRGGSWYYYPGYVRAAIRGSYYRYNAFDDLGFRCGRSP